jgi:hypothetical protein
LPGSHDADGLAISDLLRCGQNGREGALDLAGVPRL